MPHHVVKYSVAFRVKKHILNSMGFDPVQSFSLLRSVSELMQSADVDTFVALETNEQCFKSITIIPGMCKRIFPYLRKFGTLDACHCNGLFLGQLFSFIMLDAEDQLVPLAYGYFSGENEENWNQFLFNIAKIIPTINDEEFIIMSDRDKGLISAVENFFPKSHHINFFWEAAKSWNKLQFDDAINKLSNKEDQKKICEIDPSCWAQAFFPPSDIHWGKTTSQSAESWNNVCKSWRNLPLHLMIQEIYFWCSKKFEDRVTIKKLVLENCGENDEVPIGKNTMNLLTIMRTTSGSCKRRIENVNRINKTGSVSSKSELDQFHLVDLLERKCSCLGFQRLGVPCAHAISLCSYLGLDATKFIHPLLTIKADLTAYTKSEPFSAFSTVGIEEDDLKPPSSCRRPEEDQKKKENLE